MKKKIILSAGGTGGHLFPAQAVADSLSDSCEVLFCAKGLDISRYFNREKYPFKTISAATFGSKSPFALCKAIFAIARGVVQSVVILKKFQPNCVIGFGSFYTLPLLIAAKLLRVPIILHEQNSVPGKVNRLMSRAARVTAITFPLTASLMKGATQLVEFPLRTPPQRQARTACLHYFGLSEDKKTLLVFGGSQGGKGINEWMLEIAAELPKEIQILHFTGNAEMAQRARTRYSQLSLTHAVKEFETKMEMAYSLAEIAITRAGAGTIAELIAWKMPALLIPFPFATDDHQKKNGEFFVSQVLGGEMLIENQFTKLELLQAINGLLKQGSGEKRANIEKYIQNKKYPQLNALILEMV